MGLSNAIKSSPRKMLVSEGALLNNDGGVPSDQVLRAWSRKPDGTVVKLDKKRSHPVLFLGMPGAVRQMVVSGEKQDFSYASRRLDSVEELQGNFRNSHFILLGLIRTHTDGEYSAWFHPDLPEGFVRLNWRSATVFKIPGRAMKVTTDFEYVVTDSGTGALSELPDHN